MKWRILTLARSIVGKYVWNLQIEAASGVSGHPDDTAAAVAIWSSSHGYVTLEHSGEFGASGPKDRRQADQLLEGEEQLLKGGYEA